MEWLLPLIGGLGLGSLFKSIADSYLAKRNSTRDRLYQERKECYIGLLEALHKADAEPSEANAKAFGYWKTRCELFGAPIVGHFAQQMIDTQPGTPERNAAFDSLRMAMRKDLQRG